MMEIKVIIAAELILISENVANVFIDAYKIKKALSEKYDKAIKHGINGAVYISLTCILIWAFGMDIWPRGILFLLSSFLCRQVFFDTSLNIKRFGLPGWGYITTADPPAAIFDRIEIKLFGRNGKLITVGYFIFWLITLVIFMTT